MKIEKLQITIEKWEYSDKSAPFELRGKIFVNGQEFGFMAPLYRNDLVSEFEQVWQYAGEEMRATLIKHFGALPKREESTNYTDPAQVTRAFKE